MKFTYVFLVIFVASFALLVAGDRCSDLNRDFRSFENLQYFVFRAGQKTIDNKPQLECVHDTYHLCDKYPIKEIKCRNLHYGSNQNPAFQCSLATYYVSIGIQISYRGYIDPNRSLYCYVPNSEFAQYELSENSKSSKEFQIYLSEVSMIDHLTELEFSEPAYATGLPEWSKIGLLIFLFVLSLIIIAFVILVFFTRNGRENLKSLQTKTVNC